MVNFIIPKNESGGIQVTQSLGFFGLIGILTVFGGILKYQDFRYREALKQHTEERTWNIEGFEYNCSLVRGYELREDFLAIRLNWKLEDLSKVEFQPQKSFNAQDLLLDSFSQSHSISEKFQIYTQKEESFLLEQLASFENPYQECARRFLR